jgi:hypothetical protein
MTIGPHLMPTSSSSNIPVSPPFWPHRCCIMAVFSASSPSTMGTREGTSPSRMANASLDLDTVIRRVVEGAKDLLASDQARITLRDPQSGVMRFRYWIGIKYEGYGEATIEPGKGIGGQVLLTGRLLRTDNYAEDPRSSKDYMVWARTNRTIASMPTALKVPWRSSMPRPHTALPLS